MVVRLPMLQIGKIQQPGVALHRGRHQTKAKQDRGKAKGAPHGKGQSPVADNCQLGSAAPICRSKVHRSR